MKEKEKKKVIRCVKLKSYTIYQYHIISYHIPFKRLASIGLRVCNQNPILSVSIAQHVHAHKIRIYYLLRSFSTASSCVDSVFLTPNFISLFCIACVKTLQLHACGLRKMLCHNPRQTIMLVGIIVRQSC